MFDVNSLEDLIGWPVDEILEMAAPLDIEIHITKEVDGRLVKYFNTPKGGLKIVTEDGKVADIWLEE